MTRRKSVKSGCQARQVARPHPTPTLSQCQDGKMKKGLGEKLEEKIEEVVDRKLEEMMKEKMEIEKRRERMW